MPVCRSNARPTPSQEIIGQLTCASTGPLNCPPPPAAANPCGGGPSFDCSAFGGGGGGGGGGRASRASRGVSFGGGGGGGGAVCGSGGNDDQYAEGARRVLETMNRLWQDQKLCDVIIQAQCDQIKAHKVALAAHSEFLIEKFCKFPAGEVISIDMSEFPMEVICAMLTFIYTTEIEITNETVGPLLKCADELGICVVVGMCIDFLSHVTVDSAIMFYSIAENYDLCDIKECIYKFICDNFSEVSITKHFVYLPAERLYRILADDCLKVQSELEVFCALLQWLDFDREDRLCMAPKLLQCCVRLQYIPPEQLITKVEPVDWLFQNPDCEFLINEAIRYHALKLSGSRLACSYPQQKPRGINNVKY